MDLARNLPNYKELLDMQVEQIAPLLLKSLWEHRQLPEGYINIGWLSSSSVSLGKYVPNNPSGGWKVSKKLAETWTWLQSEALISQTPDQVGSWFFITDRGEEVLRSGDFKSYTYSKLLPQTLMDPVLSNKVRTLFIAGDYDTAVFNAFRTVEVRVRRLGNFRNEDYGDALMKKAFNITNGPLTDKTATSNERQSLLMLFSGSIGLYKNPSSHRFVNLNNPHIAANIILTANNLLSILKDFEKNNKNES